MITPPFNICARPAFTVKLGIWEVDELAEEEPLAGVVTGTVAAEMGVPFVPFVPLVAVGGAVSFAIVLDW